MKICTKCGLEKPSKDFYRDKRSSDRLYSKCKSCHMGVCMNYQKDHKEDYNTNAKRWSKANPDKVQKKLRAYRLNPENRAKTNAWNATYKSNNKGKINSINAGRRAAQLNATPPWLITEMKRDIDFFYYIRENMKRPKDWHVDHIIPLQGENVSGLHVPWNLRVIPAKENMIKHNKLIQ